MIHTPSENMLVKHSFINAITATTNSGTGIDCRGYRRAVAVFDSAPSGAGTTSDCKLQESSDDGSGDAYADVSGATFTQVTTAGGQKVAVMNIDLAKRERYLRLVHTGAGASAAGQACGVILLLEPFNTATISQDVTPVSV